MTFLELLRLILGSRKILVFNGEKIALKTTKSNPAWFLCWKATNFILLMHSNPKKAWWYILYLFHHSSSVSGWTQSPRIIIMKVVFIIMVSNIAFTYVPWIFWWCLQAKYSKHFLLETFLCDLSFFTAVPASLTSAAIFCVNGGLVPIQYLRFQRLFQFLVDADPLSH